MLSPDRDIAAIECARELAVLATNGASNIADTLASFADREEIGVQAVSLLFQWAHPTVRLQAIELLSKRGVLSHQGSKYRVDTGLASAVRVALRALAPYIALQNREPALYVTPPDLLERVPHDVGEIRRLLVELVASTKQKLILVTPFVSEVALREVLTPLQAGTVVVGVAGVSLTLYLSLAKRDLWRMKALHSVVGEYVPSHRVTVYLHVRPDSELAALPHAKLLLSDGTNGYLGSANISLHGLHEQFEVGLSLQPRTVRAVEDTLSILVQTGLYNLWKT